MAAPPISDGADAHIPAPAAKPARAAGKQAEAISAAKPARAEPSPAKATPEHEPAPSIDWQAVIAGARKKQSLLTRLNGRSRLAEVGKGSFVIEVFDKFTKMTAEDGREQLEAAIAAIAGTPLHMECRLNETSAKAPEPARGGREAPEEAAHDAPDGYDGETPEPPWDEEAMQVQEMLDFGAGYDS
jgi:hypothetical protein